MANTWGGLTMNVMEYGRAAPDLFLAETEVIPSYLADGDTPQTVLTGWGTRRRKINIKIKCTDAEWGGLGVDHENYTKKQLTFTDPESVTWTEAIVEVATLEKRIAMTGVCFVSLTFIEVTSGV